MGDLSGSEGDIPTSFPGNEVGDIHSFTSGI